MNKDYQQDSNYFTYLLAVDLEGIPVRRRRAGPRGDPPPAPCVPRAPAARPAPGTADASSGQNGLLGTLCC